MPRKDPGLNPDPDSHELCGLEQVHSPEAVSENEDDDTLLVVGKVQ